MGLAARPYLRLMSSTCVSLPEGGHHYRVRMRYRRAAGGAAG